MDDARWTGDRDDMVNAWRQASEEVERAIARDAPLPITAAATAASILLSKRGISSIKARRMALRRYRAKFYPVVDRCRAAELIVADWDAADALGYDGLIVPGSKQDFFRRLHVAGLTSRKVSTVTNDLDERFDD